MVPGGGFEPPTRGFSVHCSTPELPGLLVNGLHSGGRLLGPVGSTVQRYYSKNLLLARFCVLGHCFREVFFVSAINRNRIGAGKPLGQIQIRTAFTAKRAIAVNGWFLADWAAHVKSISSAARARWR